MTRFSLTLFMALFILPSLCWSQIPEKEYYANGDIKVDWYSPYGDNDLTRKEYFPRNILKNEAHYENGNIEGIYREYNKVGNMIIELNYRDGLEHGKFKEYTSNGILFKEGNYEKGKIDGHQIVYDLYGDIVQDIEYRNGVKHGKAVLNHPAGIPKEESNFKNGKLSGKVKFYDDKGRLKAESWYQDDVRQGVAKEYYPSGKLRVKMNFVDDKIEGELIEYYENQQIKKKNILKNSEIIKREAYTEQGELIEDQSFDTDKPKPPPISPVQIPVVPEKENMSKNIFKNISGVSDFVIVGVMLVIFLFIGLYIGKIVSASKIDEVQYQNNVVTMKEDYAHRQEFNSLRANEEDVAHRQEFNPLREESEKMYRHLIETVKSGIFMSDENGHIFYGNHMFAKIFGHQSKQDVLGLNINNLFRCIDHDEKRLLKVMGEANGIADFQFKYRLDNSEVIVLSVSANRILNEQGKPSGLQGVVTDITEKKELEDSILNEKKKLESILGFFENIEDVREREKLAEFSVKGIADILEAETCLIVTQKDDSELFCVLGAQGLNVQSPERMTFDAKDPLYAYVKKTEQTLFVENIEYDERFTNIARPPFFNRSFIIAPLISEDQICGMILVSNKHSKLKFENTFAEVDAKVLTIMAGKVSTALDNIEMYNDLNLQTVIDPITKIYNYRLLSDTLDREIHQYGRDKNPFFVLMMDVDDFKSYNDTYGHTEGDELLKNLGKILSDNVRQTDVACRYAGDEFCIVLTNTTLEGAINPAKKIIQAVEEFKFKRKVTISIGIANYEEGMTKKEIISKADKALYEAKNAGKNKYVVTS